VTPPTPPQPSSISEPRTGPGEGALGRTLGAALAVAAASAALYAAHAWESLDNLLFDSFTVLSAPGLRESSPVVIVGIDEPSFSEVGLRWPWPRELHAKLVAELTRAGVSVIAFDVLFSEPSDELGDARLAEAIRATGRVVLAGDVVLQATEHMRGLQRIEPLPAFREAGARTGIASIEVGRDQVVRQFPQDPEAFWRVAAERHGTPFAAPGPGAMLRYSGGEDVGYVSYYQALDAARLLPEAALRGKIALVGLALKTSPDPLRRAADTYATPFLRFTKLYAPGVEIQGQFVAAALAGHAIRPLAPAWAIALSALALALGILGMRQWRVVRCTLLALGLAAVLVAASFLLFDRFFLWLPVALPVGVMLGLYAARATTAYLDEIRRKLEIRRAFEFYVAPAVVAQMTSHPERLVLGGERRELTVMFTDLAGFTSISEGMAPEGVARILNEHLTRMTDIVLRFGGTIDKFIGDAVMAFWGAPLDDPAHARRAVEAAIEMQREMARWHREAAGQIPPDLSMRIGINTGSVVVGNLGSRSRFDYTVIGDAVNLASRLEAVNKIYGTEILLTDATASRAGDGIAFRHVDRIRVKGKQDAIEVFTPAGAVALGGEDEAAIAAYRAADWDRAESLWRAVLARVPGDGIASTYLERIAGYRREGVAAGWDATFTLDSK
jgi:adenylate cyclase